MTTHLTRVGQTVAELTAGKEFAQAVLKALPISAGQASKGNWLYARKETLAAIDRTAEWRWLIAFKYANERLSDRTRVQRQTKLHKAQAQA